MIVYHSFFSSIVAVRVWITFEVEKVRTGGCTDINATGCVSSLYVVDVLYPLRGWAVCVFPLLRGSFIVRVFRRSLGCSFFLTFEDEK